MTDSFAIVVPHDPNDATPLRVPGETYPRAQSDRFGPALVSDIASYSHSAFPIEAEEASAGYDLGSGVFDVHPDYKSGFVLKVGSDYRGYGRGEPRSRRKAARAFERPCEGRGRLNSAQGCGVHQQGRAILCRRAESGRWRVEMIGVSPRNASG